jgi:Acetyltransferase (GNAT) family
MRDALLIRKKLFFRIAKNNREYEKDALVTEVLVKNLGGAGVDIYTFLERTWCCSIVNPPKSWTRTDDNVGLMEITTFDAWFNAVGKKTRNMVRRAEKSGVKVKVVELNPQLVEGIWKIYNETPIRQGRAFPHFGESIKSVTDNMQLAEKSTFIGAYLGEELVGFIQIIYGDNIAIISQILSLQKHWDKSLNNALLAKAVEVCAANGIKWLMYGRIGNHPSLDKFKESNGFKKCSIARYYVPISSKGKLAIRLGLHRDFKDALPQSLKGSLIPVFNWISRNKVQLKLHGK